jgi:hypothetical protein
MEFVEHGKLGRMNIFFNLLSPPHIHFAHAEVLLISFQTPPAKKNPNNTVYCMRQHDRFDAMRRFIRPAARRSGFTNGRGDSRTVTTAAPQPAVRPTRGACRT